jgi:hypothetical protein
MLILLAFLIVVNGIGSTEPTSAFAAASCVASNMQPRYGTVAAKVDGGSAPTVFGIAPAQSGRCGLFLVAVGRQAWASRLSSVSSGARVPHLDSAIALAGGHHELVAVRIDSSSSTETVALFGVANGRLVRIAIDNNLALVFGAGPAIAYGTDCVRADGPGVLVASSARRSHNGWSVTRRFFAQQGLKLAYESKTTTRVSTLGGFAEFTSSRRFPGVVDFPSCATARAS